MITTAATATTTMTKTNVVTAFVLEIVLCFVVLWCSCPAQCALLDVMSLNSTIATMRIYQAGYNGGSDFSETMTISLRKPMLTPDSHLCGVDSSNEPPEVQFTNPSAKTIQLFLGTLLDSNGDPLGTFSWSKQCYVDRLFQCIPFELDDAQCTHPFDFSTSMQYLNQSSLFSLDYALSEIRFFIDSVRNINSVLATHWTSKDDASLPQILNSVTILNSTKLEILERHRNILIQVCSDLGTRFMPTSSQLTFLKAEMIESNLISEPSSSEIDSIFEGFQLSASLISSALLSACDSVSSQLTNTNFDANMDLLLSSVDSCTEQVDHFYDGISWIFSHMIYNSTNLDHYLVLFKVIHSFASLSANSLWVTVLAEHLQYLYAQTAFEISPDQQFTTESSFTAIRSSVEILAGSLKVALPLQHFHCLSAMLEERFKILSQFDNMEVVWNGDLSYCLELQIRQHNILFGLTEHEMNRSLLDNSNPGYSALDIHDTFRSSNSSDLKFQLRIGADLGNFTQLLTATQFSHRTDSYALALFRPGDGFVVQSFPTTQSISDAPKVFRADLNIKQHITNASSLSRATLDGFSCGEPFQGYVNSKTQCLNTCNPGHFCEKSPTMNLFGCRDCPLGHYCDDVENDDPDQCDSIPDGASFTEACMTTPICPWGCIVGGRYLHNGECPLAPRGFYSPPDDESLYACPEVGSRIEPFFQFDVEGASQPSECTTAPKLQCTLELPGSDLANTAVTDLSAMNSHTLLGGDFTLELWMNRTHGDPSWDSMALIGAQNYWHLEIINTEEDVSANLRLTTIDANNASHAIESDLFPFSRNEFVHVMVRGDDSQATFFVNGQQIGATVGFVAPGYHESKSFGKLHFGGDASIDGTMTTNHFIGMISQVYVHSRSVPTHENGFYLSNEYERNFCNPVTTTLCSDSNFSDSESKCVSRCFNDRTSCSCNLSCPEGFETCPYHLSSCVLVCPNNMIRTPYLLQSSDGLEECGCGCQEDEFKVWKTRHVTITSHFGSDEFSSNGFLENDGYLGLTEIQLFDETGARIVPTACVASSEEASHPCSNLYDSKMSNNDADMWMTDNLGSDIAASVTLDLGSVKTINRVLIYNWNGAGAHRGMRWIDLLGDGNEPLLSEPIALTELTGDVGRLTSAHGDAFDDRALLTNQFSPVLACSKCSPISLNTSAVSLFGTKDKISDCICNIGLLRRQEKCLGPLLLTPIFNITDGSILNLATDNVFLSATLENIGEEDMDGIEDCIQINYWTNDDVETTDVLARYCRDHDSGDWIFEPLNTLALPQLTTTSISAFASQTGRLNSTTVVSASYSVLGNLEVSVTRILNGSGIDCLPDNQFRFYKQASVELVCTQSPESPSPMQIWVQTTNSSSNEWAEFVRSESALDFEILSSSATDGSLLQPTNFSLRAYCASDYYFDAPQIELVLRVIPPLYPPSVIPEPPVDPSDFLILNGTIVVVGTMFTGSYSDQVWCSLGEVDSVANWTSFSSSSNASLSITCQDDFRDHNWILFVKSETEGFESTVETYNYTLYCAPNVPSITPNSGTYWQSLAVVIDKDNDDERIEVEYSLDNGHSWNISNCTINLYFTDVGEIDVLSRNVKSIAENITLESATISRAFSLRACTPPFFHAMTATTRDTVNISLGGDNMNVVFDQDDDILLFVNNTVPELSNTPIYVSLNGGDFELFNETGILLMQDFDETSNLIVAQQQFEECQLNFTTQITYIIEPQPPSPPQIVTISGTHWEQVEIKIESTSPDPRIGIEYSLDGSPFQIFNPSDPVFVVESGDHILISRSFKNVTYFGISGTKLFSNNVSIDLTLNKCSPPIFQFATFDSNSNNITSSWNISGGGNNTEIRFSHEISDEWDSIIVLINNTVPELPDSPIHFSIVKALYDISDSSNRSLLMGLSVYDEHNPPILAAPNASFQSLPIFYILTAQQFFAECNKNFSSQIIFRVQTKVPPAPPDITIPNFSNVTTPSGDLQIALVENEDIQLSTNDTDVVVSWQIVDIDLANSDNVSADWNVVNSSTGANVTLSLKCVNYTDQSVSLRLKASKNSVESPVYTYNMTLFCNPPPPAIYPESGSFPSDGEPLIIEMNNTQFSDSRVVVFWSLVDSEHRELSNDSSFSFDSPLVLTEPGDYTVFGHTLKNVTYRDPLVNSEGDIIRQYSVLSRCEAAIAMPPPGQFPCTQDLFVNLTAPRSQSETAGRLDIFFALDDSSMFSLLSETDLPLRLHFGTNETQFESVTRTIRFFTVDSVNGSCFEGTDQQANYTILPIAQEPVVDIPLPENGSAGYAHNITLRIACPSNGTAVPCATLKDLSTNQETNMTGSTSEIEVTLTNTTAVSTKCFQTGHYPSKEWSRVLTIMPHSRPKPPVISPLASVHTLDSTNDNRLKMEFSCDPQPDCQIFYTLDGSFPTLEIIEAASRIANPIGSSTHLYDPLAGVNVTDVGPVVVTGVTFHSSFEEASLASISNYLLFSRFKPLQWSIEPGSWLNTSLDLVVPSSSGAETVQCAIMEHSSETPDELNSTAINATEAALLIQRLEFSPCQGGRKFLFNTTSTVFVRRSCMNMLPQLPAPFIENGTFFVNHTPTPDDEHSSDDTTKETSTIESSLAILAITSTTFVMIVGLTVVAAIGLLILVGLKRLYFAHTIAAKAHTAKLFTVSGFNVPQRYQTLQ